MHTGGGGEGGTSKIFEKFPHKNAIKHDLPDFLKNPKYPQKNLQKKPRTPPPPPLDFQLLCIYANKFIAFATSA
jgi:hypothetical protein